MISNGWSHIRGGWRSYTPSTLMGAGLLDSSDRGSDLYYNVTADSAMRIGMVSSCVTLRSETMGMLPFNIRDKTKRVVTDHPANALIHDSPNSMQTAPEFWSVGNAHTDLFGNAFSKIERTSKGVPYALNPWFDPTTVVLESTKSGRWFYRVGRDEKINPEDMLHLRGFGLDNFMGMSRLEAGRRLLSMQLSADDSAMTTFRQGMKVGGFFGVEENMDSPELVQFKRRMEEYGKLENQGKWMVLLRGMKPFPAGDFKVKPAEAELLQSRYLGNEEICRLFCVPPQLVGQTDKASSWASSIENINLYYLMYSVAPTLVRREQRVEKRLLTPGERSRGLQARTTIAALQRVSLKDRMQFYASALQNGYFNRDEVRDLEERGTIPGGQEYTIQTNLASVDNATSGKGNGEA